MDKQPLDLAALPEDHLLQIDEIVELLRLKRAAFYNIRRRGEFPPPTIEFGNRFPRWSVRTVKTFIRGEYKPKRSAA